MRHLKVKAKLLTGFALVSVMTIIVGAVGIIGLNSSVREYSEMLKLAVTAEEALANMRESFQLQRLMARALAVDIDNPEKVQKNIEALRLHEADMENAMAVYESTIIDQSAEKDYYTMKDTYMNAYAAAKQKIIKAAESGDYDTTVATLDEGSKAAVPIVEGLKGTIKYMGEISRQESDRVTDNSNRIIVIQITVMILAVVCAMILGLYISAIISKPIKTMSDFFVRFGTTGDLSLSEEDQKNIAIQSESRDEIGQCINAAAKMVSHLLEINEKLGMIAKGDLTAEMEVLSDKDSLGLVVTGLLDSLEDMFGELRAASGQVSFGAEQISQGAQELASGASQQAASVEEFSATLSGMQEKTRLNAENSMNAAKVNEKIGAMIDESVSSMSQMLEAMKEIDESSKSITRVIKVIDDIAFQTNILALNAAVEAARAGQHGKGFAVVADEVRNLASKSAAAAKETAALIEGSSEKVREGNQIVDKTNSSLEAVAEGSKEVVRLIGEVSVSSGEQASAIKDINQGIEQISSVVQENSASAQESAAAAEQMSAQASMLDGIVARFKLKHTESSLDTRESDKRLSSGVANPIHGTDIIGAHEKYK